MILIPKRPITPTFSRAEMKAMYLAYWLGLSRRMDAPRKVKQHQKRGMRQNQGQSNPR